MSWLYMIIYDYIRLFKYTYQWWDGLVPSTYKFLDALGNVIYILLNNYVIFTWHPKRDVVVKPNAKSNKSYYSSFAEGSC